MVSLKLIMEGDGAWPDLAERLARSIGEIPQTEDLEIAALRGGMSSGKPSIMIRFNLPDGKVALGQTSLALFLSAAEAFKAKYGDPRR